MKFGGKAARRREAERADSLTKKILKEGLPKARPEGNGVCRICLTKNGHTAKCSRIS